MRLALVRGARWLTPLLGLVTTAAVADGPVAPSDAPSSWIHYTEKVTIGVTQWLESEDAAVVQLRRRLIGETGHGELVLSLWIEGDRVSHVRFGSLGDPQADADLNALLVGRRLDTVAPRNMRQPLNIAVELQEG